MAALFIPETGAGVADANAYADLSFAHDYFKARGMQSDWQGTLLTATVTAPDFATTDEITHANHGFVTGDGPVTFSNAGGALPAGLVAGTEYWIVRTSASKYQLATSYANAIAAVPVIVNITDAGTGTQTATYPSFTAQKEAIVLGTDYIEQVWVPYFRGRKGSDAQGLYWPAEHAYDDRGKLITGVPVAVKKANAEYALRAQSAPLLEDDDGVVSISKSAAPFSVSKTYGATKSLSPYPAADTWLRAVTMPLQSWRA